MIYSYNNEEDQIIQHVTITDNQIVEDMKANKKWLDLSILDRGQVRDIQEQEE
jgi:hypothetical protein